MNFQIVLLWSDALLWLLLVSVLGFAGLVLRSEPLRAAWGKIGASRKGMAAATLLVVFVLIALLDSLHYRPRLPDMAEGRPVYGVEVYSLLDVVLTQARTRLEKTYSAPFATRLYAKENIEQADGRRVRDYPRLKHGGTHLGDAEDGVAADAFVTALKGWALALALWILLAAALTAALAWRRGMTVRDSWRPPWRCRDGLAWDAVLWTLALILLLAVPLALLSADYHVFGTDKVGQSVLYQVLKSVRTALVIGLVPTLVTLPLALLFGLLAGYFGGWLDDVIQYLYTVLSSIPGVLLIAAAVLMIQVVIDTHPDWFASAVERADLRLLALCFILGLTSWTGLCRLLRGEAMKLRELDYVQAARAFGVGHTGILTRHVLPNVMHIVIISVVMGFSSLVLSEAVLSYVGVGVDPNMTSFGTMINNARLELGREPVVWWSLLAAMASMFILVLAANLFADVVRDAFDPRTV
ncbi:MAG: Glutathione transport system permease protein GsiD [Betaproteobacteria bacterium ADurb.Bin341]|nr:MAG: Glutathione transport system permease protein GsiD [Betaproteobacteria bacterium ADurb.Bin341]